MYVNLAALTNDSYLQLMLDISIALANINLKMDYTLL